MTNETVNREGLLCYLNEQMLACKKNNLMLRTDLFWDASAVVRAIKEYPAEESGWISVEERLPEIKERYPTYDITEEVIAVDEHNCIYIGEFSIYKSNGRRRFMSWGETYVVTHWMPLPVVPKEV